MGLDDLIPNYSIKMKVSKRHYFSRGSLIRVAGLLLSLSHLSWSSQKRLPDSIRIVGIFDRGGDLRHQLGFTAAIDTINARSTSTKIVPEILNVPPGAR